MSAIAMYRQLNICWFLLHSYLATLVANERLSANGTRDSRVLKLAKSRQYLLFHFLCFWCRRFIVFVRTVKIDDQNFPA
jgi:hypothetical protein